MKAPAFWETDGLIARLLSPLGWLYGLVTSWRMGSAGAQAGIPVICIGNLTVGGAGKTPSVLMLAQALREAGETPMIVSRGYGGRLEGPVLVDPEGMTAADCGDEPLLLVRHVPTIVSRDRAAGANLARQRGATVALLDDGLQNPRLAKDFSVAVIDGGNPFGNGRCFPAGPLRAPIGSQTRRIDCFLIVSAPTASGLKEQLTLLGKPTFLAELQPDPAVVERLRDKPLLAFAGIGRPSKFFKTLEAAGLTVGSAQSFGDHHAYTPADLDALRRQAAEGRLTLVTTEKDATRLPGIEGLEVFPVTLETPAGLVAMALEAIGRRRSGP